MAQWRLHSKRKATGGLLRRRSKKKRYQRGSDFLPAHIGPAKVRELRTHGNNTMLRVLSAQTANVSVNGKARKAAITTVAENPADSQFVRRNIITKGAILLTELGRARVTGRPGRDGAVNAVIIDQAPKAPAGREEKAAKKSYSEPSK
ncbi:MAG: 30S ribosomal protein S8e [Candidatus Aenigmarchaeota archaeon]|nr:30S ribosomal protein S8e [Candidatus Aenigmarchaeota archaeon]